MKALWLAVVTIAVMVVSVPVANLITGQNHWLPGVLGGLICLVPALATMQLVSWFEHRGAVESIGSILVAPLIRVVIVLALAVVAYLVVPTLKAEPLKWLGWVSVFYLVTLVAETALLLPKKRTVMTPASPDSPPAVSPGGPHG
jgi:F0F1-type ATP synthase assembly protein I